MSQAEGGLVVLKRKVLRRFYEPLLLLNALGQVRGNRIKPDLDSATSGPNHQKTRRSFADGIAYICAYNKGPDYVTATALERSPQGTIVWLAANSEIKPEVLCFLQNVLDDLDHIATQGNAGERDRFGERMQDNFLTKIVAFNEARLRSYYKKAKVLAEACLPVLGHGDQPNRKSIRRALSFHHSGISPDEVDRVQLISI
jgi:hypothetical protein